jgi:hypothetical protein
MLGAAGALALAVVVAAGAYFIDGGTEVPDDPASTDPAPADALSTTDDAPEALGAGGGTGDASTPVDVESSPPPAAVPPLSPTTKVPTATHAPAQSSTSTTPTAARTANTASAAASGATASAPSADGSDAPSASVSSSRSPSTTPVPEPAHVSITGDAARVVAVSGSTRLTLPAELPAGQWDLLADFPDLQGTIAGRITVADGERLTVNCIASMAQCRRK